MKIKHVGISAYRLRPSLNNPREVVFAEQWADRNENKSYRRHGVLEVLIASQSDGGVFRNITQVEATTAATVVQWLGSPVGFEFLEDCLNKCGYRLEPIKK
jgi:hypothetical protein